VKQLALFLLAFAFPGPTPYEVPEGAYRFHPYEFYRTWHTEMVHCVGMDGYPSFSDIEWWAVPAPQGFHLYGGGPYAGYYDRKTDPDRIYLVDHDLEDEGLVKHEIGHQALPPDLPNAHPVPPYVYCAPLFYDAERWKH
jgi:hypothetical protein